ncbi:hypothetical protein PIN31009_02604 [Pandoraea iniqua]|nr:hypothetical protein PIN31009_02604 [Pandoraea iniqua]
MACFIGLATPVRQQFRFYRARPVSEVYRNANVAAKWRAEVCYDAQKNTYTTAMNTPQHGGWGRVALLSFTTLALSGCISPTTQITSVRAPDYKAQVHRIFVIYDGQMRFGADFGNGFRQEVTQRLASCEIESQFGLVQTLMLDTRGVQREIDNFRPDVVLRVRPNGGVVQGNLPIRVDFVADMADNATDASVWRGVFQVHHVGTLYVSYFERGGVFATDLINRLITDGMINNCPILPLDPGNRLPSRGTITMSPKAAAPVAPSVPASPASPASPTAPAKPPQSAKSLPPVANGAPAPPAVPGTVPSTPSTQASQAKPEAPPPPLTGDAVYRPKRSVSLDDLNGLLPPAK